MKKILLLCIVSIFLMACDIDGDVSVGDTQIDWEKEHKDWNIPYANSEELLSMSGNDDEIVDYRLIRFMAMQEFAHEYEDEFEFSSGAVSVSELPVVLYGTDSRPHLYEFIVYEGKTPKATITTVARKEDIVAIQYVLPFVRDYSQNVTKWRGYKQIVGKYPFDVNVGVLGKSGEEASQIVDTESGEAIDADAYAPMSFDEYFAGLGEEELEIMEREGLTETKLRTIYEDRIKFKIELKESAKKYWDILTLTAGDGVQYLTNENLYGTTKGR